MTHVSVRARIRRSLTAAMLLFGCTACSSVASVNERALLLGPDTPSARPPIDPTSMIRPTRTEYRIGAQDVLEVEVYELEEPNKGKQLKVRVTQDGTILMPLIGSITAAGLTAGEVQGEIAKRLAADFLVNPSVTVVVAEHQARRITVLGAVQHPGAFHLKDNATTLVDALALAGGPNDKAGSTVYVVREHGLLEGAAIANASSGRLETAAERPRLVKVDLVDLVERGDLSVNCLLEDGDVVHVPPAAQFFVMGQVANGGAFPLRGEITLLRAIALAGGLKEEATPAATILIRTTPQGRITIPIDLNDVEAGSEKDLLMQPDDVLVVSESDGDRFTRGVSSFLRGLFHISYGLR